MATDKNKVESVETPVTETPAVNEESWFSKIWKKVCEAAAEWWKHNSSKFADIVMELVNDIIKKIKELFLK